LQQQNFWLQQQNIYLLSLILLYQNHFFRVLEDLFSSALPQFKKYHPSRNLKSNNLGIFQSLKLRILVGKRFQFFLS